MSVRTTRDSFIVRVYRYDPEDQRRVNGLVEATDGSGITAAFANTEELGAILNRLVAGPASQPTRRRSRRATAARQEVNR